MTFDEYLNMVLEACDDMAQHRADLRAQVESFLDEHSVLRNRRRQVAEAV